MEIRENQDGVEFVVKKRRMGLRRSVKTGSTILEIGGELFSRREINVFHQIMSLFTLRQLIEITDLCGELDPEDWAHLRDMLRDWPDALERFRTEDAPASGNCR